MGHMTAREYGRKARATRGRFASLIQVCSSLQAQATPFYQLTRCDRSARECYDQVDAISLHNYYGNTPQLTGNDTSPTLP